MKNILKNMTLSLLGVASLAIYADPVRNPFVPGALPVRFISKAAAAQQTIKTSSQGAMLSYTPVAKVHVMNPERIGKDIDYGTYGIQNIHGGSNSPAYAYQDRVALAALVGRILFAVCDGHGMAGDVVAQETIEQLPIAVLKHKAVDAGFRDACRSLQEKFLKTTYAQRSGTTLVGGVLSDDPLTHKKVLTVGHIGDSRLVVIRPSRKALVFATVDHKSTSPRHTLSRSLGDKDAHASYGLTAEPTIEKMVLEEGDVVMLASDGYWDTASNQETCELVTAALERNLSCKEMAQELAEIARARKSKDDITVVCVRYKAHH